LMRAGYLGAFAAWAGFTLPSAIALLAFAYGAAALRGPAEWGLLHGLKLVAVAIVAQAVWGMARSLCPDRQRATIAGFAALIALFAASSFGQIAAICFGGIAGLWFCRSPAATSAPASAPASARASASASASARASASASARGMIVPVSRRTGIVSLAIFVLLLLGLPLFRELGGMALFGAFYRSGALVFGGGHVVLPLLRDAFVSPGWVGDDAFLAGYGAAQAVPGPLFTFAVYLGAVVTPSPHGVAGAALGLIGIFLPGLLILVGTLPFWEIFRTRSGAQAAMRGINAAVVGILGGALYDPLWTGSIKTTADLSVALIGFILLTVWRAPPVLVVGIGALAGIAQMHINL
jgi:chromate transporter